MIKEDKYVFLFLIFVYSNFFINKYTVYTNKQVDLN
jgi:hypothetical protein